MKATVVENKMVVEAGFTKETFEKVKTYAPDATKLFSPDGDEIFGINLKEDGDGKLGTYSIDFVESDGKLIAWAEIEPGEDARENVMEKYGIILANLNDIEGQIDEIQGEVNERIGVISECIITE